MVVPRGKRPFVSSAASSSFKRTRPSSYRGSRLRRPYSQRVLSSALGLERKFIDYEYDAAVVATVAGAEADPATALSLAAIAQGDGESNRDGRQVRLVSLQMRGYLSWAASDTTAFPTRGVVRILVVWDKQTNGAQLNAEDVLLDPTDTDHDLIAMRNLQYSQRFQVLKDFFVGKPPTTSGGDADSFATGAATQEFNCYIKLPNIPVTYSGTTAAIGSITDNSLHVIAITNSTNTVPTLRYISRVRFVG